MNYIDMDILKRINMVRQNPKGYVPTLQQHLERFTDELHYKLNENTQMKTHGGKQAVRAAITELNATEAVQPLEIHQGLQKASIKHSKDLGDNGNYDHVGSDGSTMEQRVTKFCGKCTLMAENISISCPKP